MTLEDKRRVAKKKFVGKHVRLYRGDFDEDQEFFLCTDVKCSGAPSGWFCNYIFIDEEGEQALMWGKLRDIQIKGV